MSSSLRLNLSRSPFVNRRPVRRLTIALWVIGGLLLILNVFLIWSHRSRTVEGRAELAESRAQAVEEVELSRRLRDELASMDLGSQNAHVDFLNQRIAQRTFPWSLLFDQMVEVMPRGVRLQSLSPGLDTSRGRGRRAKPNAKVNLAISAQAENGEAMLEFVERLFAHPAFEQPNLMRESTAGSITSFLINVIYRPDLSEPDGSGGQAREQASISERSATGPGAAAGALRSGGGGGER